MKSLLYIFPDENLDQSMSSENYVFVCDRKCII